MSRIVLLRYDADVYRVRTVLPAYLQKTDGAAKGGLFRDCDPYSWDSGDLRPSPDNFHLQDLVLPARKLAKQQFTGVDIQIDTIADQIVAAGTQEFLGLLDVATLPRYPYEHAAGQPHKNGDYLCRCWPHRECIDSVGHAEDSIESMAIVIESVAVILKSGILVRPEFDRYGRTNFVVNIRGQQATIGIVDAADKNAAGVEKALSANKTIINGSPYLVRRTSGAARPPIIESRII